MTNNSLVGKIHSFCKGRFKTTKLLIVSNSLLIMIPVIYKISFIFNKVQGWEKLMINCLRTFFKFKGNIRVNYESTIMWCLITNLNLPTYYISVRLYLLTFRWTWDHKRVLHFSLYLLTVLTWPCHLIMNLWVFNIAIVSSVVKQNEHWHLLWCLKW